MARKRKVEVVVISDVHLGTYGCHAKELLAYLKSIKPDTIILNGDIIDIWQFSKSYWPASHMRVVKHLMGLIAKGTKVYYITGNHDEMLRKFVGFNLGSFQIVNKLVMELDGKRAWMFHGDVFDVTMQHSKWLAKLGAHGYDLLILLNRMVNFFCLKLNREKVYLSRNIKNRVKSAVKFINNFEKTASDIAISSGYDYVVCGHIHQPELREITNNEGSVTYLNSGDWIENLTALEYEKGAWSLYKFRENLDAVVMDMDDELVPTNIQLFQSLMVEFNLKSA
ncbi:UDP-2,3-diacylglucosamine diphosphatase [Pontibacter cellulosilyticus]|uniref:UDP-2,3-diacylglucosamine diphosphatase n=1 Tax=Pontibacter cellulosilyticus TaxID=1720253 RepID=A0A923SJ05_9BACT|nr:UDP-2,3-diacylglucosamine diphosphatase [Pontibacter cellulosilyticus]MBC5992216.1 UDP-2,3-diacylglucosamine diphosphatase [Pontibacter cellulosilyticus]